jgi:hypothetical protein
MLTPFERGLVAHLVADWLLQNDWMALNKANLRHPAGWVHGLIHGLLMGWALGWLGGLVLGIVHVLIDVRSPVDWWMRVVKKCDRSPQVFTIGLWTDQVFHIVLIAAWVAFGPK